MSTDERMEFGDADLDLMLRRPSIEHIGSVDGAGPLGQGVMASMSSIILTLV